jgi:hypothetical protein
MTNTVSRTISVASMLLLRPWVGSAIYCAPPRKNKDTGGVESLDFDE